MGEQRRLEATARTGCGFKLSHGFYIGSGEVGIYGVESSTDFGSNGFCRPRRANKNISVTDRGDRLIDLRDRRFFQAGMAYITDHSDDGAPLHMVIVNVDAAADSAAICEEFIREASIDNGESVRMSRIAVAEAATGKERNAHCGKVSWSNPSSLD